jgi:hypothetical protein
MFPRPTPGHHPVLAALFALSNVPRPGRAISRTPDPERSTRHGTKKGKKGSRKHRNK